jgi:hypothetical protein
MKVSARRRIYRREAAAMLAFARLAVWLLPPARIFAWANRAPGRIHRFAGDDEAKWISWAVEDIAARPWMPALCLPRALAAHAMLRRRGIASRLCLGVARSGGELAAHAWIEVGCDKVVGVLEAEGFTRLAAFGAAD